MFYLLFYNNVGFFIYLFFFLFLLLDCLSPVILIELRAQSEGIHNNELVAFLKIFFNIGWVRPWQ